MAGSTDIEKLVVQMSAEFRDFNKQFAAANGVATRQFNAIQKKARETDKVLNSIGKNMARNLTMPITGIGAALGVRELIKLADTWTDLNGRVRIATGSQQSATDTMGRLSDIARRTYSSLELTTESFLLNSQALKGLGYSTAQQLDYTEALNNALVVSGAKGQRAEQVQEALSKAMALGALRGKELNTVISSGGRVAQALADGLGVSTNELRKLGEQGQLTSSKVIKSLTSQAAALRKEADGMQATIGDAIQLLHNSFLEYVGGADQASGASAKAAQAIILVADNLDTVANAALVAATAIIGALAGRAMGGAIMGIAAAGKALKEFIVIARTAQGLSGLGAAFGALGTAAGPIGLIVGGAAALAVAHFASQAMEAEARTSLVNAELERMGIVAKKAADGIDDAAEAQDKLGTAKGIAGRQRSLAAFTAELVVANRELDDLASNFEQMDGVARQLGGESTEEQRYTGQVVELVKQFREGKTTSAEFAKALDRVALAMPDWSDQIAKMQTAADRAEDLRRGYAGVADELERVNTTDPNANRRAFQSADSASMAGYDGGRAEGERWIRDQTRRNALTKEQRDIEDEMARIRKDMPHAEFFSPTEIAAQARANLATKAGDKGSTKQTPGEKYAEADAAVRLRLKDMEEEIALQATLNPLVNDYGYATEKLRIQQELRNAATKAGLTLDDKQQEAIDALAAKMADATVEAARLAEAQGEARQTMVDWFSTGRSVVRGFIDDLVESKSAAEALGNAFGMIGNKLLDLGLNAMFGTGSGANPFGLIGTAMGFDSGGYTGAGGRKQPAGVVHKGEVVWSQDDVARHGGPGVVDAMRRGMPGYDTGGIVNMRMPSLPKIPQAAGPGGGAPVFEMPIHIDARGADEAAIARLERGIGRMQAEFEGRVRKIVRERSQKGW